VSAGKHGDVVLAGFEPELAAQQNEGALKPEFDVGDVKASLRPFRSAGSLIPLPG